MNSHTSKLSRCTPEILVIHPTGHEEIDAQHQGLFELINDLGRKLEESHQLKTEEIEDIVHSLYFYANNHFRTEENYMREIDYSLLNEHIKIHQNFMAKIKIFQKKFFEGDENLSQEIFVFLKKWLVDHIQKEDMKIFPQ